MKSAIIEVKGVSKRYGEIHAVNAADLVIYKGEIFSLIGHNGAGKSTLFKMMLGLLQPTNGEILIRGKNVNGRAFREVKRRIGYLPENVVFYDHLTGIETLHFIGKLKGADLKTCPSLLDKMGLLKAARRPVRGYSKGMRQRLGFAQALLGEPEILFLDEPTTGLDPAGIREFYQFLQELKEQGVTIILSSHNLAQIQEQVDRIALMKMGDILTVGSVADLRQQLDLPLHIQVRLDPRAKDTLRQALSGFTECELDFGEGSLMVTCTTKQKMPLLTILATTEGVTDIQIQEPSLEDLFLGYVSRGATSQAVSALN